MNDQAVNLGCFELGMEGHGDRRNGFNTIQAEQSLGIVRERNMAAIRHPPLAIEQQMLDAAFVQRRRQLVRVRQRKWNVTRPRRSRSGDIGKGSFWHQRQREPSETADQGSGYSPT